MQKENFGVGGESKNTNSQFPCQSTDNMQPRHSKGKIIYPNGEIYEGDIFEGKRHGKGKLTLSDGTVIEGTWIYGSKMHEYTDEDYENAGGDARFDNTNC